MVNYDKNRNKVNLIGEEKYMIFKIRTKFSCLGLFKSRTNQI